MNFGPVTAFLFDQVGRAVPVNPFLTDSDIGQFSYFDTRFKSKASRLEIESPHVPKIGGAFGQVAATGRTDGKEE
jgi:hypothetical protein